MKLRFCVALLGIGLAITCADAAAPAPETIEQPGEWSAAAVYLWPGDTGIGDAPKGPRVGEVWSPGHLHLLRIDDNRLVVRDKDGKAIAPSLPIANLAEVEWSPDSRAFVITQSNGDWTATWSITAYAVTAHDGLQSLGVEQPVTAQFQSTHATCNEIPDVGSGGWLNPRVLLVVVEMPIHSSCRNMEHMWGYAVSVADGRILRVYDNRQLLRNYVQRLGRRFIRVD